MSGLEGSAYRAVGTKAGQRPLRAGGGRLTAFCAVSVVLLVLAGSLSPFQFDVAAARAQQGVGPLAIGWQRSTITDLLTNIVVYLPIGSSLAIWLRRRVSAVTASCLATLIGAGTSLIAESLQTCIPLRTASWIDVLVNVSGTWCGALSAPLVRYAARRWLQIAGRAVNRTPMTAMAAMVGLGLFVQGLAPFDFVTSTADLHASLAATRWIPLPDNSVFSAPLPASAPPGADLSAWGVAGMFGLLGFLLAMSGREQLRSRQASAEAALGHAALLAMLVEAMQLFVVSQAFDSADILVNVVGAAFGLWFAIYVVDMPSRSQWLGRPGLLFRPVLLVPALVMQVAYHLLSAAGPSFARGETLAGAGVLWTPFAGCYGRPLADVCIHFATLGAHAAMLAVTVALIARRLGRQTRWWIAATAVLIVAVACQTLQHVNPIRVADTTDPLIGLGAAVAAALVCETVRRTARPAVTPLHVGSPATRVRHVETI